ncbi:MAG TPA: serine/threonine-protein kinase [Kofleriaceae bacterium]|nr:serine/threonine-protein kinase [Kofleriaceae bacterium]
MIRRLAVGGMGEIFLVRQQIAGVTRLVVVKRLLAELADDPQRLTMFVDEARIAANLSHPGIVAVHEFGHDADGHFIVMEYVPGHHVGRVLARAVRDGDRIPVSVGAYIVYEVARALDHAHHACDGDGAPLHIVHRDVSPSNVLLSFSGDVKLMDFGIARAANRSHRTNDGTIRGKFAYMAPEQIESTEVDATSDVFSAGVLLWELTLGRRLFDGATDFETIRATLEQPIPRPTTIDASYPPALEAVVMAALERDRTLRLPSAAELATALKAVLREHPADRDDVAAVMAKLFPGDAALSATLGDAPAQPSVAKATVLLAETPPAPRRRRWLAAAVAAGLAVLVGVIAWPMTHGASSPPDAVTAPAVISHGSSADAGATPPPIAPSQPPVIAAAPPPTPPPPVVKKPKKVTPPIEPPAGDTAKADRIPVDAAAVDGAVAEGRVHFRLADGEDATVYVIPPTGVTCNGRAIQTRCQGPAGSYPFVFQVPAGVAFSWTVTIGTGLVRCAVSLSRKDASCGND